MIAVGIFYLLSPPSSGHPRKLSSELPRNTEPASGDCEVMTRSLAWIALALASGTAAYFCFLGAIATGLALGGHTTGTARETLESRALIALVAGCALALLTMGFLFAFLISAIRAWRAKR